MSAQPVDLVDLPADRPAVVVAAEIHELPRRTADARVGTLLAGAADGGGADPRPLRLVTAPQLEPDPDVPVSSEPARTVARQILLPGPHGSHPRGAPSDSRASPGDASPTDRARPDVGRNLQSGPGDRPVPLDAGAAAELARLSARRPTATAELPDPTRWAHQFVQAAVEVAAALRPAVQLVRWTEEDVYRMLVRRGDIAARARRSGRLSTPQGRARVRSARAQVLRDGVAEASAVVGDGVRFRCVALRMEGLDGRWRVTALELG